MRVEAQAGGDALRLADRRRKWSAGRAPTARPPCGSPSHGSSTRKSLQRAQAEDGIPALVTSNSWCWSSAALPSPPSLGKVLSVQTQSGTPLTPSTPQDPQQVPPDAVTVINPAKLPYGTELLFDYVRQAPHAVLAGHVIHTHAYTCEKGAPPYQPGQ